MLRQLLQLGATEIRVVDIMALHEEEVYTFNQEMLNSSRILAEDIYDSKEVVAYKGSYLTVDLLKRLASIGVDDIHGAFAKLFFVIDDGF